MASSSVVPSLETWTNPRMGAVLFVIAFFGFWLSPVSQMQDADPKYSLLVSERLLSAARIDLDPFFPDGAVPKDDWRIHKVGGHFHYFYPPGTPLLSIPFVAAAKLLGYSVVSPQGKYLAAVEQQLQALLAALLMGGLVVIFYYSSRLLLSQSWSCLVALGAGFGTQVWSTMSRALWSDTWGAFLIAAVLWMLMTHAIKGKRMNPVVCGSLLAWAYFVRPTYSLHIAAITGYILLFDRTILLRLVMTGAVWLALFVGYSWANFQTLLPSYYRMPLHPDHFGLTLAGNLISPSRGLIWHVPVVLVIAGITIYHWPRLKLRRLVVLAGFVIAVHLALHSCLGLSLGGGCFGARFSSGLVPWFVLCTIVAIEALLKSEARLRRVMLAAGAVLLAVGIVINGRGALALPTWTWNSEDPMKVWDWRYPQFLAGLRPPPPPTPFQPSDGRTGFASAEAGRFLWFGWSGPETSYRWSDSSKAGIVFSAEHRQPTSISLELSAFLVRPKLTSQTVVVRLQGKVIQTLVLDHASPRIYRVSFPPNLLRARNELTFTLPDAARPQRFGLSDDARLLAIKAGYLEFHFENVDPS